MSFSKIELPSNKKFGLFFSALFAFASIYFFFNNLMPWIIIMLIASIVLFIITLIKADILLPLNKLWMRFGFLLGMIVSPIILGILFFGLFTPISLLMRLGGRDELRLNFIKKKSHWISRSEPIHSDSFKYQF